MGEGFSSEEEELAYARRRAQMNADTIPLLTRLVLSTGLVKTRIQAEYVLSGLAIGLLVLAAIIFFSGGSHAAVIQAPPGMRVYDPGNAPPKLVPAS